jgi:hypothetical protein
MKTCGVELMALTAAIRQMEASGAPGITVDAYHARHILADLVELARVKRMIRAQSPPRRELSVPTAENVLWVDLHSVIGTFPQGQSDEDRKRDDAELGELGTARDVVRRFVVLRKGLEKLERCEVNRGIGEPDPSGDWVQWTDIIALLERGEQAASKLAAVERDTISVLEQQRDDALDRLERLRERLELVKRWTPGDVPRDMHDLDGWVTEAQEGRDAYVRYSDIRALLDEAG